MRGTSHHQYGTSFGKLCTAIAASALLIVSTASPVIAQSLEGGGSSLPAATEASPEGPSPDAVVPAADSDPAAVVEDLPEIAPETSLPAAPPPSDADSRSDGTEPGSQVPTGRGGEARSAPQALQAETLDESWAPTENPKATVEPGQMRSDREEIPEGFTKEEADKAETMEARLQGGGAGGMLRAAVAPGCQVYWPAPYEVCGAIRDKYNALGGPNSFLLFPKTGELTNPDGYGKRTEFVNGPIYWSPQGGAHPVVNHFLAAWARHGYEASYIGYPTTDEIVNPDGIGRRQHFTGSTIYWRLNEAYSIGGEIQKKWNSLGAERGQLGYPISDELVLPDGQGRMNRFEKGVIYWHPTTGARMVAGDILNRWSAQGYERGPLGYPISDAQANGEFRQTQRFQRGVLHTYTDPIPAIAKLLSFTPPEVDRMYDALVKDFGAHGTSLSAGFKETLRHAQESYDFTMSQLSGNQNRTTAPAGQVPYADSQAGCEEADFVKPGNERTNRGDIFYSVAIADLPGPVNPNHGHNGIFVSRASADPNNIVTMEAVNKDKGVQRLLGRDRIGVCKPTYLSVDTNDETRNKAAGWAETKAGAGYESDFTRTRIGNLDRESYNCSSLIWAAFKHASGGGLDIGEGYPYQPYRPGVYPMDILHSHNTREFS